MKSSSNELCEINEHEHDHEHAEYNKIVSNVSCVSHLFIKHQKSESFDGELAHLPVYTRCEYIEPT